MISVVACITTLHNLWLVGLAAVICVGGGFACFELLRRALERKGRQQTGWVFLAAVAGGSSVWCTHFIAMLAYEVNAPVTYDPILTMLSLLIVMIGCGVGFRLTVSHGVNGSIVGGVFLGLAVSAMHYTGMLAYRVDGILSWDPTYVAASLAVAVVCGAAALYLVRKRRRHLGLAMFVLTVVGLHFTGMTAVTVTPLLTGAPIAGSSTIATMAVAVAGVAMLIVGTVISAYMIGTVASEETMLMLRQMAHSDALTGLPNRASFYDYVDGELERAAPNGTKVAVVGIDLDKFKDINDLRGHDAGDEALRTVARRLSRGARDGEFVARLGGDEFAALKRFTDQRDLNDFLARLESELFRPMRIDDFEVVTGASIGVAIFPQDGDTAARLVSNADLAMYRAKADVTRALCFYEAEMDEKARARRELGRDLRRAIDRGELSLHYQVQTSVADPANVVGYEVLLRWTHARLGPIVPDVFIPLAEETGTILTIGEWVLREACREAARWDSGAKIAVNLSPVQLTHGDMPRLVHQVLMETGLPAARLELEITESTIIQDKARSLHALRQIRALGVTIAIDDFGTGYSSLDTLRSFPFDRIKLDRSFMKEVETSAQARAIIRAVLALGRSLEISVLAEGVETSDQLDMLRSEGCNEAQGYFLGRPQPIEAFGMAGRSPAVASAA